MKRLLSLSVCLLTAILSCAHDFEVDGICYNITSSSEPYTVAVTYKRTEPNEIEYTGVVTIPESVTYEGNAYSVISIGSSAFRECSGLTSVTIPNSVTSIGDYAFESCSELTSVTIPNSVTIIGVQAFKDCSGLTSIIVESGNTTYDSRDNCNAIIETASNTLVAGCKNTVISNSVTSIGDYAFARCINLINVTIPESVTSIGLRAFASSGLTSVTIPNNVTSIGRAAFNACQNMTSLTIGNSAKGVNAYTFFDCDKLTSIKVVEGNPYYDSRENCNALIETASNTLIRGGNMSFIPNGVQKIGYAAFAGCKELSSLSIPSSVTTIGEYNQEIKGKTNVEIIPVSA